MAAGRRRPLFDPPPPWGRRTGPGWAIHLDASADPRLAFAESIARGLDDSPRTLDCRWLYDDAGSRIFERITEQPEYYQTRAEASILAASAADLRERAGDVTLVELGSGSSAKTRRLLDAWCARGPSRYVPIDISPGALEPACRALAAAYPELAVEGIAASYERGLELAGAAAPLMLLFLGSTVGNLTPDELDRFLEALGVRLAPGDRFLLGIDLVKDPARLEAAYNDQAGWSARFTLNLFDRMNRELGTRIPLDAVDHVAYYEERLERIEIYARFRREVRVDLDPIDRHFRIAAGEMVRTEISRKFHAGNVAANAARFGFRLERSYEDPDRLFGLLLLRRGHDAPVAENRKRTLEALLARVRARTLEIVSALPDDALLRQHDPLMSPVVWDLGHVANYESQWLLGALGAARPAHDAARDKTYDSLRNPRRGRGGLALLDRPGALGYLDEVRRASLAHLAAADLDPLRPLTAAGYVHRMVAQHEAQHQETVLQAVQLAGVEYDPPFAGAAPRRPDRSPDATGILVPAGAFQMGTDDRVWAYDNERPRQVIELSAYRIDAAPVTNASYLTFMEDGGYRRPELWTAEGWAWREEAAAEAPRHWTRTPDGWRRRIFGTLRPIDPDRPVMHVCWYEADAWARWAGKRLPTEAEWEKAAAWDPERAAPRRYPWGDAAPTPEHANLDQRLLEPAPAGSYPRGRSFYGCHQMLGDVWEWTASWFQPYPGFESFPYREYSEVFFGTEYRVLRGGSWATPPVAIRCTFRNWDFPQRRQIFAGFRCASDA